jgi:hypothetical protein
MIDAMQLDPHTVAAVAGSLGLVLVLVTTTAVWWTRGRYPGYGRCTIAGPMLLLSLFLLCLRPKAPARVNMVAANTVLAVASILSRSWLVYAGGVLAIG